MIDAFTRLSTTDRLLASIVAATGLLIVIAAFLVVLTAMLRFRNLRRERLRVRLEKEWNPLLLAALSGEVPLERIWAAVPRAHSLFFIEYLLRYITRFVGEERDRVRRLAQPYLPLVARQLDGGSPEVRARAVQTLARVGFEAYRDLVLATLDDPSDTVAMVAARALATQEHADLAPMLLHRLHRFRYWEPGYLASMYVGMGSEVVPALRAILADDSADLLARRVAADALFELDDIAAADTAARVAWMVEDDELAGACLHLLSRVGSPRHADVCRRALETPSALRRLRAATALGSIGGEEDLLRLTAALDDPFTWVRLAAARAIADLGGPSALSAVSAGDPDRLLIAREVLSQPRVSP